MVPDPLEKTNKGEISDMNLSKTLFRLCLVLLVASFGCVKCQKSKSKLNSEISKTKQSGINLTSSPGNSIQHSPQDTKNVLPSYTKFIFQIDMKLNEFVALSDSKKCTKLSSDGKPLTIYDCRKLKPYLEAENYMFGESEFELLFHRGELFMIRLKYCGGVAEGSLSSDDFVSGLLGVWGNPSWRGLVPCQGDKSGEFECERLVWKSQTEDDPEYVSAINIMKLSPAGLKLFRQTGYRTPDEWKQLINSNSYVTVDLMNDKKASLAQDDLNRSESQIDAKRNTDNAKKLDLDSAH